MIIEQAIEHFKNNRECEVVFDLASEDVERILRKEGFLSTHFEEAYFCAVGIVRQTLVKRHLRGVGRFYSLPPDKAIKWLLARLVNTVKTILTDTNNPNYLGNRIVLEDNFLIYHNCYFAVETEMDLLKLDPKLIKEGLKKVWQEGISDTDFDWVDFTELCEKYKINSDDIVDSKNKAIIDRNGCSQLFFDF